MLAPTTLDDWHAGKLLSVGDRKQWLLVEMPHGAFVDALPLAESLRAAGVRLIVAHAERYAELLDDLALSAKWIEAGCLIQVTARALAEPADAWTQKALQRWVTAASFTCSVGRHCIDRRLPVLAGGFARLAEWAGRRAERIACHWASRAAGASGERPRPPARAKLVHAAVRWVSSRQ